MKSHLTRILLLGLLTGLTGCLLTSAAYREGRELAADGNLEAALPKLRTASTEEPNNPTYRAAYLRSRDQLLARWLEQAEMARRKGQSADAEKIYRRILEEDPQHSRAKEGLAEIGREARLVKLQGEAEAALKRQDFETAMFKVRTILSESPEHAKALELKRTLDEKTAQQGAAPQLHSALNKPITIEFKEAPLRQIFEIFSRTSGLNFVFDKDVKGEQRSTIFLRNSSIRNALELVLLTNQLEQRVLDSSSILIYPATAAKQKDYQPLITKTFFLSNVDLKTAANTLKTIVKAKDVIVDEKQNLIVMRDTPDAVRLAEKLLSLHDLAEPEIMLDVAIVEVSRSRLIDLGIQWPNQLSLSPLAGAGGNVTLSDLRHLGPANIGATLSPAIVNVRQTDGDTRILANPRIRARNREVAKIMIGERIPNITSTSTSTGFVAESINYVDIGLKLEVQPTVFADNEVAIKVALEVSNIVDKMQTKSGSLAYQIGTRNASTLLKLKDGENQVLAGLIRNDESSSGNGIPFLSDIPVLGRLFGSRSDNANKSEIILSITPRIIRNAHRAELADTEFDTGTEAKIKMRLPENPVGVSTAQPASTAPVIQLASPAQSVPVKVSVAPPPAGSVPVPQAGNMPAAPGGDTVLTLQAPAQVKVGGTLAVQLAIQPGEAVTGVPFAIAFDPKVLEVVSVTEGDFLKQGGSATNFSNRVDKGSGQIFATITRSASQGATAAGTIATVNFRALAPAANARIQFNALAPIGAGGKAITVTPPAPHAFAVTP